MEDFTLRCMRFDEFAVRFSLALFAAELAVVLAYSVHLTILDIELLLVVDVLVCLLSAAFLIMLLIASIDGWMDASERISILCVAFTGFMLQGVGILLKDIVVHVLGIALLFSAYVSSWRVLRRKRILLSATASVGAAVFGVLLRLAGQPIQASTLIYIISSSLLTAFALMALLAGELKNIEEREKEAREAKQKAESEYRMYQSIKRFALSGVESLLRLTVQSRARHPAYPSQYSAASSDDELLEEVVNALLNIYRATFFYNIAWEEKFYENLKSREGFISFSGDSLRLRIPLGTGFTSSSRSSSDSEYLSEMAELEPEAAALLLHPLVRRAAAVHQLPLVNKVYLGATHTRLEHMVGVAALAGKVADALYDEIINNIKTYKLNNLEEAFKKYIKNDEKGRLRFKVLVQVAALLHDVGHFGLGHAIDGVAPHVFERFLESEMLIRDKPDNLALRYLLTRARGTDTDLPEHVQWALTIRGLFDEKISKEFVEDVLGVSFYETVLSGKDPSSSLAYLIRTLVIGAEGQKVTNSLDLDRVDYLTRDFIHTRLFTPIEKDILEKIDLLIQNLISNANNVVEIKKSDEVPALFFAIKDKDIIDARDKLRNIMYSYVYSCSHKLLMDAIAMRLVFEACKILEDFGSMRFKRDDARRAILALLYAPTETVLPLVRLILDLGYRKDDEKKELLHALYDLLANYEMYANTAEDLSFDNNSEVSFNVNGRTLVIKKITLEFLINSEKIFEIVSDKVDEQLKDLKANLSEAINKIRNGEKIEREIIAQSHIALDTFCERYVLWLRHSEAFEHADAILSDTLSIKKCIALYSHASILRNIYSKVSIPPNLYDVAILENLLTKEAVAFAVYFRNQEETK